MARISVVLGAVIVILCTSLASARMYFLPDYQNGAYLKRVSDGSVSTPNLRSCADYSGFLSATDKGNMDCSIVKTFPQVGTCYSDCFCNTSKYPYTKDNCKGTYIPQGESCVDDKEYYTSCHNQCDDVTNKTCTYGCQATYSACPSKCQTCYTDNCRNRTAQTCAVSCSVYYSDCSSKCQTCCDFGSYPLSACPSKANCGNYVCGGATRYKINSCAQGYYQSGNSCIACSYGEYGLANCPTNATCANYACGGITKYKLTSCNSSYYQSGNSCVACNFSSYPLSSCPANATCGNTTCGGVTKYKFTQCVLGYYDKSSFICGSQLCYWKLQ